MLRRMAASHAPAYFGCAPLTARRSMSPATVREATLTIAGILKSKGSQVISVRTHDGVASITRTLAQHRIGAVLVVERDGTVLGIVSERDIVRALASLGEGVTRMTAGQLMTRVLFTVSPRSKVTDALQLMTDRRIRHLPVLEEDGSLAGMISIGDLVKARIAEAEREAEELKHFVTHTG